LLREAGLEKFVDFQNTITQLKDILDVKYKQINEVVLKEADGNLVVDKNGKIKFNTPTIDSSTDEFISTLLSQFGQIPILQVLSEINTVTNFAHSFKHFSVKHTKMAPKLDTVMAGIIGKGCNIGIHRIANISVGINKDILNNTVNWCFSLNNIQNANNKIVAAINKLVLANAYKRDKNQLHTGSDGQKINVVVDSLIADYSFKYFGKGKGVTIYAFLDERQILFYTTVISSSEREAAYVIDGLLHNDVIKSNIHSTDTHGYTETIFAVSHFLGVSFAPRIKKISKQRIYGFSARKTYEKRGYKILPSRIINSNILEQAWDDILRFMVTIKLKYTTASQLLKRLSSYAKDHKLYKALKEFGRIVKSIFILTYLHDVELRQRIEKQLNKVELSNKFSKAVFFANNQEFKYGTKEEQEIIAVCKTLIQNAIVLWNYLRLSQILADTADLTERQHIIGLIKKSSVITWQHINLQGEYDFTRYTANDNPFDLGKIYALKVA